MDAIAAAVALLAALFFLGSPFFVPLFAPLYEELGTELPSLTWLALQPWASPLLAVPLIAWSILGLRASDVVRRRLHLAGAAVGAICLLAVFVYALYLPMLELTGNIAPD